MVDVDVLFCSFDIATNKVLFSLLCQEDHVGYNTKTLNNSSPTHYHHLIFHINIQYQLL